MTDRPIQPRTRLTPDIIEAMTRPGLWEGNLVDESVRVAALISPDGVAVIDRGAAWTFAEIDALVDRTAGLMEHLGVGAGDVVSWQLPNWVEAVVVHHAAIRAGAISNPIVPIYRDHELAFILGQARSRIFFLPKSFRGYDYASMAGRLAGALPDLEHVVVVPDEPRRGRVSYLGAESDLRPVVSRTPSADDVALLLYTSGTTADPKGAMHSHNTLDYENRSIANLYGLTSEDVVFMPSPLTHITGILYGAHLPFMLGATVVLQHTWDSDAAVELVRRHGCTFSVGATPFLHGLLTHSRDVPTSIRVFACGGADVPPNLIMDATKRLGGFYTRIYGSTEFPTAVSAAPGDPLDKCAHTDGRPIDQAQVRVVGHSGEPLGPGLEGDLQVAGPETFLGYLDPELNVDSFTEDGWFRTGDRAVLDADGYLTITGRVKDIIIRGGENLSAKEVEDHVYGHPAVDDVAVVGFPDPVLGERVCAFVVLAPGAVLPLAELSTYLVGAGIATQKLPERLEFIDELPRTASGKIQKYLLRERLASGSTENR